MRVTTNHVVASMRFQAEDARRANGSGKSEGCVVQMKAGNSGGGKAAERWRHLEWVSTGHSARFWMLTRSIADSRDLSRRDSHEGEPDALTAHVRFWEGAVPNWTWLKNFETTQRETKWTAVNTNLSLKPKGTAPLTTRARSGVFDLR